MKKVKYILENSKDQINLKNIIKNSVDLLFAIHYLLIDKGFKLSIIDKNGNQRIISKKRKKKE